MIFIDKIRFNIKVLFTFLLIFYQIGAGQDIQFSQFYASNLYSNPAFAGSTHSGRLISHSRYQWPTLEAKYLTTLGSFDFYVPKIRSGFGILGLKDWQGSNKITTTEIQMQYSYELPINDAFTFRYGLQLGYVSRYINYAVHNFPDQFSNTGPLDINTSEPFGNSISKFTDVSTGGLLYSKSFWLGLACHHVNTPNQSFYDANSELPMKGAIATGYKIFLKKDPLVAIKDKSVSSVIPSLSYKFQGKSDQLDLGVYYLHNSRTMFGAWYRGLPLIKQYARRLQNNESFALLFGLKSKDISISYSYDLVISKLHPARTGGAHELNIVYLFAFPKKQYRRMRVIPCPDFD